MRTAAVIAFSAIILLSPTAADAGGGNAVTNPTVGTANPAPPTGSEIGVPANPKPALGAGGTVAGTADNPAAAGIDTSTAAPGGQAESSKNGALSTPMPGDTHKTKHHKKNKLAESGDASK